MMAQLGFRIVKEMVGRTDRLEPRPRSTLEGQGARLLEPALPARGRRPDCRPLLPERRITASSDSLDMTRLLALCRPAIETRRGSRAPTCRPQRSPRGGHHYRQRDHPQVRRHRACRTTPIRLHFRGSAGQSFGAFLPPA